MFLQWKNNWNKKKLNDERFLFLFDENQYDEVVVFDTETTGLNPKKDNIVSIGAVKIRGNTILTDEALHILVEQPQAINGDSIKIHQIRNCDLEGAVSIEEAIERFLYYIGNRTLVGYYLEFDVAMINRYIKPLYGITLPNKQIEVSALYYDKKIERIPQGNIDLRFDTILSDLGLPKLKGHDALNDAIMTAMAYLKLKNISSL
ncbi:MAG TPA: 3'-5' exonuclease [Epsilonproteobacteria bacterium]|nr:3'-5' exonuclease [Campylobacterota bacterium]